eukprot:13356344-Alexandrium_andersonii.AAC.1
MARRSCLDAPLIKRACLAAEGESTGAGVYTTGGAVVRIHLAREEPRMASEASGVKPLTKS